MHEAPSPRGQHRESPARTPSRRHSPAAGRARWLHRTSRSFKRGTCSLCMDRNLHPSRSKLYFRSDSPTTSCSASSLPVSGVRTGPRRSPLPHTGSVRGGSTPPLGHCHPLPAPRLPAPPPGPAHTGKGAMEFINPRRDRWSGRVPSGKRVSLVKVWRPRQSVTALYQGAPCDLPSVATDLLTDLCQCTKQENHRKSECQLIDSVLFPGPHPKPYKL